MKAFSFRLVFVTASLLAGAASFALAEPPSVAVGEIEAPPFRLSLSDPPEERDLRLAPPAAGQAQPGPRLRVIPAPGGLIPGEPLPPGWTPKEFNGVTYYMILLGA